MTNLRSFHSWSPNEKGNNGMKIKPFAQLYCVCFQVLEKGSSYSDIREKIPLSISFLKMFYSSQRLPRFQIKLQVKLPSQTPRSHVLTLFCIYRSSFAATREMSFVHAISSAGVMYSLTRNCSLGNFENCGCDEAKRGGKEGKGC